MTGLEAALGRLSRDLESAGTRYALVGGLAISARVEPRTTRDLDVAVSVSSDDEAEALVGKLRGLGYSIGEFLEETSTGRLGTVRVVSPVAGEEHGVVVDLIFFSSGVEAGLVSRAERLAITDAVQVPVARIGDLLALKVLAGRPQDQIDAVGLVQVAPPEELDLARADLEVIARQGLHRGKDLEAELDRIVEQARSDSSNG